VVIAAFQLRGQGLRLGVREGARRPM